MYDERSNVREIQHIDMKIAETLKKNFNEIPNSKVDSQLF